MSDVCSICRLVEENPPWLVKHPDNVVSLKPFGAATPLHRMFLPDAHIVDAAQDPHITGDVFAVAAEWGAKAGVPFNLVVNSGSAAGQTLFHLHVHYIPREVGDGLGYRWKPQDDG